MTKFLIVHQKVKIRKRQFNFTGHKVICLLLALLLLVYYGRKLRSSPSIFCHWDRNCFILHVYPTSCYPLSPHPGLGCISFCSLPVRPLTSKSRLPTSWQIKATCLFLRLRMHSLWVVRFVLKRRAGEVSKRRSRRCSLFRAALREYY